MAELPDGGPHPGHDQARGCPSPVVGFFVTGTSAVIPPRTPVTAYLDEDLPVVFANAVEPAPLVVPVAKAEPAVIQAVAPAPAVAAAADPQK